MIDDLSHGPFLQSEDGRRSFTVYATVRYDVDLASRVVGRHPLLDPPVLALVLMGVSFLVAAAVSMVRSS